MIEGGKAQPGIGERVRAARVRHGLSREELAVRTGLSWSALAQIETGRRTNVRPGTLAALAEALGVTADYLLGCPSDTPLLEHHALVYAGEDEFMATAAPFLRAGAEQDEPTIAVTTPRNIELLRGELGSDADRVTFADAAEWYSRPAAALTAYRRFALAALEQGAPWARVLGEPVWSGRSDADVKFWTRYESLLNLAFAGMPLTVVCPYDAQALPPAIVEYARATHERALGPDGLEANADYVDPSEFILRT